MGLKIICNLEKIMADKKITQKKLGELTGIHHTSLKKLRESRASKFDANTLIALCSTLNIKLSELLEIVEV